MSTSSPASKSASPLPYEIRRPPPRRRIPFFRCAFILLVIAAAALFEPHCFRFAFAQFLRIEAWRCGVVAQISDVDGTLFTPVTVANSVWIYESENGPVTRLEVKEARAEFSWRDVFSRGSAPWFRSLTIYGATGKVQLPIDEPAVATPPPRFELPRPHGRWLPAPARIEAHDVDFIFESDGDYVRLQNANFAISEMEPGELRVGQVVVKQPWLNRTFRNVQGTTKLDSATTELAAVKLEPDVTVQNLSVELAELARGRLNLEMQVAAFGGNIRIETQTLPHDRQLAFEATGTFSQIGIARLASFLGQSEAAGGTIKEGKFTFRGAPQAPSKATASLRIEATNFQWESRQWDSLVLGASLLDGHVQIPDLTLHQGHNYLKLNGEFALPAPNREWWQDEFAFDINARIENLTELSALMLPEFKYAAGKGTIDGSVRGKDEQFHGQIIVTGSNLTWRSAPIEDLHATLKLNGNELELSNLSLFNGQDYVRGRGVVNILGDKQYWGELRASIDELGKYSALLQKPIVPEPLAGGAMIDWSGEGSAKGHTGKFLARLRKLRSLGASAALLHPINADFEGTYQPGAVLFSQFTLSDDSSSFTANVAVGNKALSLQDIHFVHGPAQQLQGDALLPLDVWQAWPNTSFATLLNDTTVSKIHLTATDLDLHAAAQLTGWNFPIEGLVRGELTAEGAPGSIASKGQLTLSRGRLPLGWTSVLFSDVAGEASFDGQKVALTKVAGRHPEGDFQLSGDVDFKNLRDPELKLAASSEHTDLQLFPQSETQKTTAAARLNLQIAGPGSAALVQGEATLVSLKLPEDRDLSPLLLGSETPPFPDVIELPNGPWNAWRFDLACRSAETLAAAAVDLHLSGTITDPLLAGAIRFAPGPARIGAVPVLVDEAVVEFRESAPADPSLTLRASGSVFGEPFVVQCAGPLSHPLRFFEYAAPLNENLLRTTLAGETGAAPESATSLSILAPIAQASETAVFDWAAIATPPAPPAAPAAPTAASPVPGAPQ